MSKFVVDIDGQADAGTVGFGGFETPTKRARWKKIIAGLAIVLFLVAAAAGIGAYFYWQHLRSTPQYSLALMVDAARSDDQAAIDNLVDTDALVDDFMPQVTAKAVELYGRGLPPEVISKVGLIAMPLIPAVKDRARAELPRLIREKTEKFANVPFAAMVLGADRYLDISLQGDTAIVKSKLPEHSFEVKMQRSGDRWKITGIRDDKLATKIAQAVGQEIIAIASNGKGNSPTSIGIKNVTDLLRQAEEIFR
jgi:hypothetical protein